MDDDPAGLCDESVGEGLAHAGVCFAQTCCTLWLDEVHEGGGDDAAAMFIGLAVVVCVEHPVQEVVDEVGVDGGLFDALTFVAAPETQSGKFYV